MLDAKIIKESFDPKLITALFKNFTNPYIALFEILDNALDDRVDGRKLLVSINYSNEDSKLIIKNHNGKGMSVDELEKFFTWGYSEKSTGKIGRYGQGGKAALGYLAKSFTIRSHPFSSPIGYCIQIKDWENREIGFQDGYQVTVYNSMRNDADVSFEIYNLKKEFNLNIMANRVKKMYRPLITKNIVEILIDGTPLKCDKINYDRNTVKKFIIDINHDKNNYSISGEYGIVPDPKSERGGFNVYQYGRNVASKEYFGHTDPSKRWNVERLYGELYINFDLPLSMNKSEIDIDSELWNLIRYKMYDELDDIMQQAKDYKTPTPKEEKALKNISKKLNKSVSADEIDVGLTNYGKKLLYKCEIDKSGKKEIKINRDHPGYLNWSKTDIGKRLYMIMIFSLEKALEDLPNKEAKKFLNLFSESLKNKTKELM